MTEVRNGGIEYIEVIRENFRNLKTLGDRSFSQLDEAHFHDRPDPESNSIAIIIQHLYGNMRSRWTDVFTSDGEKPDRHREQEFEEREMDKAGLLQLWEEGWDFLFRVLDQLDEEQLLRTVYVRAEPHSLIKALNRQLSHYAYHVGQVVYLAKHYRSAAWQSLSIPKGKSEDFNRQKGVK